MYSIYTFDKFFLLDTSHLPRKIQEKLQGVCSGWLAQPSTALKKNKNGGYSALF
jgi:hypothetical protein